MKRLHVSILALFGWFFIFYNVERIYEPINLASFVYLLAPAFGMIVLCVPQLRKAKLWLFIPLSVLSVVVLRISLGYDLGGHAFSLVVTEVLAAWITIGLSYQLAKAIDEYHAAAATAIVSHVVDNCRSFEEAQDDVVREVRRARQFSRPIAVLALKPRPQDDPETLDRFTHEFKAGVLQQYISARAAKCLSSRLRQYDILTQSKDQFLALLPEISREDAKRVAEDMRADLSGQLGIGLQVGISMFPEDEVTAIGLIERAEAEAEGIRAAAAWGETRVDLPRSPSGLKSPHKQSDSENRENESLAQ